MITLVITDRIVSDSLVVLDNAHALQGHQAAVWIGIDHLRAHLVNPLSDSDWHQGLMACSSRASRWCVCCRMGGGIRVLVEGFLKLRCDSSDLVV